MMRTREELALFALRILLSILIAAHGWARFLSEAVVPFGTWLDAQGFPFGPAIAIGITGVEILGTPLLAWGRLVLPLCIFYSLVYAGGIFLVHAPEGWFVVGLGRNGMEYSVLLIACLLCVASQYLPPMRSANGTSGESGDTPDQTKIGFFINKKKGRE